MRKKMIHSSILYCVGQTAKYMIQKSEVISERGSPLILQSSPRDAKSVACSTSAWVGLYAALNSLPRSFFALSQIKSFELVQEQNWFLAHLLRTCHTPSSH